MDDGFTTASTTAASSLSELGAVLGVSTERAANYTFTDAYSASPKYTPGQLVKAVKDSDLDDDDELRALVGNVITSVTNQLYEIIKERES